MIATSTSAATAAFAPTATAAATATECLQHARDCLNRHELADAEVPPAAGDRSGAKLDRSLRPAGKTALQGIPRRRSSGGVSRLAQNGPK